MRPLVLLSSLAALLALSTGCGPGRDPALVLALTGDVTRGEAQYQIVCASCHGPTGYGMLRAPALVYTLKGFDDETVVRAMINGRGGMPAKRITDQQAADILAWMRSQWSEPGSTAPTAP